MDRLHHPPATRLVIAPSGRRRLLVDLDPRDLERYRRSVLPLRSRVSPTAPDWAGWLGAVQRCATRPGWTVMRSDVRRCYRSIRPDAVEAGLRHAGVAPSRRDAVTAFLDRFSRAGVDGLPIGPEPSATLAGSVLAIGDNAIRSEGAVCLRWVDDVVIAGEPARVARAYRAWRSALGELGLTEHDGKHAEGWAGVGPPASMARDRLVP